MIQIAMGKKDFWFGRIMFNLFHKEIMYDLNYVSMVCLIILQHKFKKKKSN